MATEDVKLDRPNPNRQCAANGCDDLSDLVECVSVCEMGVQQEQHVVDRFHSVDRAKSTNGSNVIEMLLCNGTIGGNGRFEIALIE